MPETRPARTREHESGARKTPLDLAERLARRMSARIDGCAGDRTGAPPRGGAPEGALGRR